jgi:outer membrane protein
MKGSILRGALAAILILFSAAAAAEIRIGVVSLPRLLKDSPQALAFERQLKEEFAPREREIRSRQEELRGLQERLQQAEGFMGEEERRNVERDFREGQRELARTQNELREDFSIRQNEELGLMQRVFFQEIETYAQAQGFDLVMADGIIYASDAVDITDKILESLQRRYQSEQGGQ